MYIDRDFDCAVDCREVEINENVDDDANGVNATSGEDDEIKERFYDAQGTNGSTSGESEGNIDDAGGSEETTGEDEELKENVDDDAEGINGMSGEGDGNIDDAGGSDASEIEEAGSNDEDQDPVALFSIPSDEVLEHDFKCAYQNIISPDGRGEKFLLEGRVYIFVHFICFYGEFLGQKVKHSIPFHLITSVRTELRKGLFPNAIEIVADDEVFWFASTSDEGFKRINDKQKNRNAQTTSEELATYVVSYSTSVCTPEWKVEDVDAPKISEDYTMVLESKFSINVDGFFRFLFSDNARGFQDTLHTEDQDFKCSRWRSDDEFGYVRDMSSKHEFDNITEASFTGKYNEVQKFRAYRNSQLVITTSQKIYDESNNEHCFDVEAIWDLQRDRDESEDSCICRIYVQVAMTNPNFGEGTVEQSIIDDYRKTYEKWIEEAHDTRDTIKDLKGLESGIVRVNINTGEGQCCIQDINEKVTLKYELETDDESLRFEGSLINFAKKLNFRQEFAEAFKDLKLGCQTAMIIPPTIRNSDTYILIYVKLKGIGDEKFEEDSSDSESDSKPEVTDELALSVDPEPLLFNHSQAKEAPRANSSYSKMVKSLVVGTAVVCSMSVILGMTRAKKTSFNSGTINTPFIDLQQEKGRHPAEIMYQIITVGEGNGITKYQPGCFIYTKTGSVEPDFFEGSPTELAIKLARGYEEAIGGTISPDEESIITRLEEAIVGMKVNERRKIIIPPVVCCLREVLDLDLTLTDIKDPPQPRKNNILASKM